MNRERWQRVKQLLDEVIALAPASAETGIWREIRVMVQFDEEREQAHP